jgi:1-acyl-sn-glycerol-3-phosphate acyltransferase
VFFCFFPSCKALINRPLRRTLQGLVRCSSANSPYIHKNFCLLYSLLKIVARLAIPIFCRKIVINKPELLQIKGPVLLACNHPNSFLDSIILDTLFQQPIWSLARGDAFKKKFIGRILTSLKILPVYRTSEGVENLSENYKTFDACISLFKQKGIVTIFSEGKCINEWHLRPLKKGTARLAIKAWEENIPLMVIQLGLTTTPLQGLAKMYLSILTSHYRSRILVLQILSGSFIFPLITNYKLS